MFGNRDDPAEAAGPIQPDEIKWSSVPPVLPKILRAGGYAVAPANMHHFAWTKTGGIVEINLIGPFAITYVNVGDDPSHKK